MTEPRYEKSFFSKGIPLIKTQSIDRIEYLYSGKLYCRKLSYFRDLEKEKGDKIIGDEFEAMIHLREAYIYVPEHNQVEYIKDGLVPTTWSDDYVFCMSSILPQAFRTNERVSLISDEVDAFGSKSLIITDTDGFIELVDKAAKKYGYEMKCGYISYYDEKYDNPYMLSSLIQGISNIAFWKRRDYENQREFRFIFHGNRDKDVLELPLETDLSGISKVVDTETLKKALVCNTTHQNF